MDIQVESKLSTCNRCGRQFARKAQAHSCKVYPLAYHFKGKTKSEFLYEKLKHAVRQQVGPFKVGSLECCIHFVRRYIFAAAIILRDKIRVDFDISRKIRSSRIVKSGPLPANVYLCYVDISNKSDIDKELPGWIKESYDRKPAGSQAGRK